MHVRGIGRHPLTNLALAAMLTAGCHSLTKNPQGDSATPTATPTTTPTTTPVQHSGVELANHEVPAVPRPNVVKTDKKTRLKRASNSPVVQQLNILWSDATAEVGGVPQQSGFVAKVYLIGQETHAPIRSEGRFSVYGWNDHSSKRKIEPDRIWSFPAEQVAQLVHTDAVGAYYSFWLPVGLNDHPQQNFTLQAAFTPETGKPILSHPTAVSLPGRSRGLAWKKKTDILNVTGNQAGAMATIKDEAPTTVPELPSNSHVATPQQHRSP